MGNIGGGDVHGSTGDPVVGVHMPNLGWKMYPETADRRPVASSCLQRRDRQKTVR